MKRKDERGKKKERWALEGSSLFFIFTCVLVYLYTCLLTLWFTYGNPIQVRIDGEDIKGRYRNANFT